MNRLSLSAILLLALLPLTTGAAPARSTVAITRVAIIDVVAEPPVVRLDQTVVIQEQRIMAVGPSGEASVPEGATVLDGSGKFIIPGLWDMHVHTLWDPAIDTTYPLFVANGVTGVRDMHTHFPVERVRAWRREVDDGQRVGPRLAFGGPIVDGPRPFWPGSIAVADADAGRKAVRDLKARGVDFVKVYTGLPRDAYLAVANEAKKQRMRFAGHVPTAVSAVEASDAGQASIEHLSELLETAAVSPRDTSFDPAKGAAMFERFRANRTWQCPTLVIQTRLTFGREDRFAKDPRRRFLTPHIKAHADVDDSKRDWATTRRYYDEQVKLMRALAAAHAGADLLAGTDAPIGLMVPGFSLHDELALLVDVGLTPGQALRTATINPARFLGMEKDLGTVKKGKLADLVVLDANPLNDIRHSTRIRAVIADGRLYDRAALDELLREVEKAAAEKVQSETSPPTPALSETSEQAPR